MYKSLEWIQFASDAYGRGIILGPCFVLDFPAALRAYRSPFGEIISFGIILGPCFGLHFPAALRASRALFVK